LPAKRVFLSEHSDLLTRQSAAMKINNLPDYFTEMYGDLWFIEEERGNMKINYRIREVISSTKSSYQQINVVDLHDFGRSLILDGAIQTTEFDGYIYNEMISHIPVITHANPERILVIGGGDCGAVNEIIKYNRPQFIDMVEIDELVVRECMKHIPSIVGNASSDNRINFIFKDGVEFVKSRTNFYDIVIVDSSDPVGPAVNLFSEEFYRNVLKCLKEDGIMVCQSESPIFQREFLKRIHVTLKGLFPIVRTYKAIIPSYPGGMWSFTLATLKYDPLDADANLLAKETSYINKGIFKSCFELPEFVKGYLFS
jgi:spermidine synthase